MKYTYIDIIVEKIQKETNIKSKDILQMYALLVLVKGTNITLSDVHDAWSVAMNFRGYNPPRCYGHEHTSIVPFDKLSKECQEKDQKYLNALIKIAKDI